MDADLEEPRRNSVSGVTLVFPVGDDLSAVKIPKRIRRRLSESKGGTCTVEEIKAKLKEADIRRQQFHEWLSSKARRKPRSPSWSSQDEELGQRLEAKLFAAEQKRLSLLAKEKFRLARLDELRHAAKTGVELRFEKERQKLCRRVEYRVQQAEANRMLLLKANMQRRAAVQERTAVSLMQRVNREIKYKECIRAAICQKRAAAEKKRLRLLEAEKKRAHARVTQASRVAKSVCHQREIERKRKKEQLEDRLLRARHQREEYLRQRGSPHYSSRLNIMQKNGDFLARILIRYWRHFATTKGTTLALAKDYAALGINEDLVRCMSFEQLAFRIKLTSTLRTVKALLNRLESRYLLSRSSHPSGPENLDHLLKRLGSPNRREARNREQSRKGTRESKMREMQKFSRYSVRTVLCAYMILGHPDAVFSDQGEHEAELAIAAVNFVREFELLLKVILDGPNSTCLSVQPLPENMLNQGSSVNLSISHGFRSQLAAFDAAWHSYLYRFVVWKVKDARSLEDDLVRAACQLELSMMQTCKIASDGQDGHLTHDMKAIQKQVTEDQRLLRQKVGGLSGNAGIERMEAALSDMRSKYFESKENRNTSPVTSISSPALPRSNISSPALPSSPESSYSLSETVGSSENCRRSSSAVRSLFRDGAPFSLDNKLGSPMNDGYSSSGEQDFKNELLVNELLHENHLSVMDDIASNNEDDIVKAKIKETMKKAFWDEVMDSLKNSQPDYIRIVQLVSEVRDELCEMAPKVWKQEIYDSIDVEILKQVLESGSHDMDYLGKILEYALSVLRKLSSPASEEEMEKAHPVLLSELSEISKSTNKLNDSFVVAVVKALKFVLEQIQELKREISKARIHMMIPIIKSPAGVDYLRNAFIYQYGQSTDAGAKLPLTVQWISASRNILEEWDQHNESLASSARSAGLPHAATLRSGGSTMALPRHSLVLSGASVSTSENGCTGERLDVMLRLGLLKLVSGREGLNKETLPETLRLNLPKLRAVQSKMQDIIVISTSILVLRQILHGDGMVAWTAEVETIVSNTVKGLQDLLGSTQEIGIFEIINTIVGTSMEVSLEEKKEIMARLLVKSLQEDDAVFKSVSRSVYQAARGIMLGGSGDGGRSMADASLRRIGASMLLDQLVNTLDILIKIAKVSGEVHKPWYDVLLQNNQVLTI